MIKVIKNSVVMDGSEVEIATDFAVLILIMREKHPAAYEVALSAGKEIKNYKLRHKRSDSI